MSALAYDVHKKGNEIVFMFTFIKRLHGAGQLVFGERLT